MKTSKEEIYWEQFHFYKKFSSKICTYKGCRYRICELVFLAGSDNFEKEYVVYKDVEHHATFIREKQDFFLKFKPEID